MKLIKILFCILLFYIIPSSSANDGKPFIKTFDNTKELHVYYKAWLVICDDSGAGECRATTYSNNKIGQLTIQNSITTKKHSIVFFNKKAPNPVSTYFTIKIDKEDSYRFKPKEYREQIVNEFMNIVQNTYEVTDPEIVDLMISKFISAHKVRLSFKKNDKTNKIINTDFSLHGITSALRFIEQQHTLNQSNKLD